MLVGERMTRQVITVGPDQPVVDVLELMKREKIRRTPVVKDGRLVGIVSREDLLNASPSQATTLSVWEVNYLISKIKVRDVMTKEVLTVSEDTPIEEAARIMADNKIGGLPVVQNSEVVGIITETDLFKLFLELFGARQVGLRVTALVADRKGALAELSQAVAAAGGNFISFGSFAGESSANRTITFKVTGIEAESLKALLEPLIIKLIDLRNC